MWHDVNKKKPKHNQIVMVSIRTEVDDHSLTFAQYDKHYGFDPCVIWDTHDFDMDDDSGFYIKFSGQITHWANCPKPPKEN